MFSGKRDCFLTILLTWVKVNNICACHYMGVNGLKN